MFSDHIGQLDRLIDLGMCPEQVHVLKELLGNPDRELSHRGAVQFTGKVAVPSGESARWAVAQNNWDYAGSLPSAGGKMGYVMCRECDNSFGSNTVGKDLIKAYLPAPPGMDPNVVKGHVIAFFGAPGSEFVSPGYGDQRVGGVVLDVDGTRRKKGWAVMDGTLNGKVYGGTGVDLRDRFPRQWSTSSQNQTTGGAATDSFTVGSHSGGSLDSAVAISTHGSGTSGATSGHFPDHTHEVDNTATVAAGSGTPQAVASLNHTGNLVSTPTPNTHTHTTPALSHTVTGSSALSHGAVSVDTVPPFMYFAYLERLNNSRTYLGV